MRDYYSKKYRATFYAEKENDIKRIELLADNFPLVLYKALSYVYEMFTAAEKEEVMLNKIQETRFFCKALLSTELYIVDNYGMKLEIELDSELYDSIKYDIIRKLLINIMGKKYYENISVLIINYCDKYYCEEA